MIVTTVFNLKLVFVMGSAVFLQPVSERLRSKRLKLRKEKKCILGFIVKVLLIVILLYRINEKAVKGYGRPQFITFYIRNWGVFGEDKW